MRGEKIPDMGARHFPKGSPPHARGKVSVTQSNSVPPGITPACAGKRSNPLIFRKMMEDHPRMRGEK